LARSALGPHSFVVRFAESKIHPSGRKQGIADEDIEHATRNAMTIDDLDDDLRLYLGPARNADLLEVVTVVRAHDTEPR
jgi:hypothetical protein